MKQIGFDEKEIYESAKNSCVICNSCRYCEGFCAVFPAMEKRRSFEWKDIDYLANLCHQCGECFYACQYAPPHEFNVNIPSQFSDIRAMSYQKFAYPRWIGKVFEKNGFFVSIVLLACIFAVFFMAFLSHRADFPLGDYEGDFYRIVPYHLMVWTFGIVGVFVFCALGAGFVRFFSHIQKKEEITSSSICQAFFDAFSLKYLGGHNNDGCTYPKDERSSLRKIFHHFTFYGFLSCFVATSLGAFYEHFLNLHAPYAFLSLPKLFGTFGGISLCIGTLGLFILKLIADARLKSLKTMGMDYAFIFSLFIVSLSGLILMIFRESQGMAFLILFHLSTVLALFIMMPYGKFIHGFYRLGALIKYNLEIKKP
ncbi:citrate utilization protein B [Helicobacter sp. 12S02232-10]|uniref:tricarballylate utilization 4Fe-4S protein TcuB n=1 Tax=Helicobacter sp. 12S02232-10 TaxID=1476197 RepID=UPI000BA773B3|nr:tricarballylate utilization 4Fe-4S protein TcuB [Helicobacter sp. 12S02232-10]PAF48266.1 citrate utilization protein B [Helicobacter sp. 12S02232-10]